MRAPSHRTQGKNVPSRPIAFLSARNDHTSVSELFDECCTETSSIEIISQRRTPTAPPRTSRPPRGPARASAPSLVVAPWCPPCGVLMMLAKYSVGAQRAAPAPARHSLCPKPTLYSAGINNVVTVPGEPVLRGRAFLYICVFCRDFGPTGLETEGTERTGRYEKIGDCHKRPVSSPSLSVKLLAAAGCPKHFFTPSRRLNHL